MHGDVTVHVYVCAYAKGIIYPHSGCGLILPPKSVRPALKHTAWSEVRIHMYTCMYYCSRSNRSCSFVCAVEHVLMGRDAFAFAFA